MRESVQVVDVVPFGLFEQLLHVGGQLLAAGFQHGKLAELGLERYIDVLVTSEEAGAEKPSARIFRMALKKAGCRASETLLIGDDRIKDKNRLIPFHLV